MMRPFDGIRLASAKLRAHRVRTGIITSIVAVLFSGIVMVLCVVAGVTASMRDFGREGLGSRYIVQARPIVDSNMLYSNSNEAIIAQLSDETTKLTAQKKAEAKRLGLDYSAANDTTLPLQEVEMGNGKQKMPNQMSPVTQKVLDEYLNSLPNLSYADFKKLADSSGAKAAYHSTTQTYMMRSQGSQIAAVIDGKEQRQQDQSKTMGPPQGVEQLAQGSWVYFDSELLKPFVLPGQSLAVGEDGSIPVIAPVAAAEKFIKMSPVSSTASASEQLNHLKKLRADVAGKTAQLCYRNAASAELLNQAYSQKDEMERNKNNRDYTAPALQYNIPADACGEVTIKKDTRTTDEKKFTENQLNFKRQFEGYEDPSQGIITIRIVGLVPDMNYSMGFSAKDLISGMLRSGLGDGWFSPISAIEPDSLPARIATRYDATTPNGRAYYAEFNSYQDAKAFTEKTTCDVQLSTQEMMSFSMNTPDPRVEKCYKAGKYFDITSFGNNASAIEDLRRGVWKVMKYVAPAILCIAALVLMGVVGKIIADSRRETAVFRALGATRSSIAQIYLTYSVFIAIFIALLAILLGAVGALLVSNRYSPDISVNAVLAFNASDIHKQFTLFGIEPTYLLVVFGLVVTAALLSTLIPLLTNIRRNPIRDMRDE